MATMRSLIACLAVADGERPRCVRMELDHALEELDLSFDDIKKLLAGCRDRAEADEIDRMTCVEGVADLAFCLESTDAWSLSGPGIHHHDWPFPRIEYDPRRWDDA